MFKLLYTQTARVERSEKAPHYNTRRKARSGPNLGASGSSTRFTTQYLNQLGAEPRSWDDSIAAGLSGPLRKIDINVGEEPQERD